MTLVSVIIPTRNRLQLLQRALKSLESQTYRDFEVLIVDDASSDHTVAWLEKSPYRVLRNEIQSGAAASRNAALKMAQGEVVCFLDDDDQWRPGYLELQLRNLRSADLSYTSHEIAQRRVDDRPLFSYSHPVVEYLCESYLHTMSVVACRRELIEKVGPMPSQYKITHDYDWWARMLLVGARPARVEQSLVLRHPQSDGLISDHRSWFQEEAGIIARLAIDHPVVMNASARILAHRSVFFSRLALRRRDFRFSATRLRAAVKSSPWWTARVIYARMIRNLRTRNR